MKRILLFSLLFLMFPRQFLANEVSLGTSPQRIVSMNLCVDELLLRITDSSRIVAVTNFTASDESSTVYEAAKGVPKIKGEIEEVLSFAPDLVIGGIFSNSQTMGFLKRLEVPTLLLKIDENFEDIYTNIRILGEVTGESERGALLIAQMQSSLREIRAEPMGRKPRALFYQSGGNVPGRNTFQDAIIQEAGIVNIASEVGIVGHAHFSLERVIFEQPDILIFWDQHKEKSSIGKQMLAHPAIKKGLPHVQIITIPSKMLNCGSPASVEVVKILRQEISGKVYG